MVRFQISEADDRRRWADRWVAHVVLSAVAGIFAAAVLAGVLGTVLHAETLVGVGVVLGGLAALSGAVAARSRSVRFREVAVDEVGVTLTRRGGQRWSARWDDPSLRFLLFDHASSPRPAHRAYREIPCRLFSFQFNVGISREAFAALRDHANRAGVPVREETNPEGFRVVTVGPGPETARPFRRG